MTLSKKNRACNAVHFQVSTTDDTIATILYQQHDGYPHNDAELIATAISPPPSHGPKSKSFLKLMNFFY